MHKNLTKEPQSSFLSCEKDTELILKKLFIDERPHSDILKKLLVIPEKDCLTTGANSVIYNEKINKMQVSDLRKQGYIKLEPKLKFNEHEEIKSYLLLSFDNFSTNATNPQFRDYTVSFDIICHTDCWDVSNYALRPLKIAGYIDGLLNNTKLTGIGEFHFLSCNELLLNEHLSGYTLSFRAVHGSDDLIPASKD